MRASFASSRIALLWAGLTGALLVSGCGDFWQTPGSTGSGGGGGTTASTTTLASSSSATTVGSSVTLTASVSPSAATGSVTFYDNSASIGTGTLNSGTATLAYTFTTTGTQSLTATYGGSTTYASSTSSAVTITVSAASAAAAQTQPAAFNSIHTTSYEAAPIHAIKAFSATDAAYTAQDAEAVVVEGGGSVTLTGTALKSAAGAGRGILLSNSSPDAATQEAAHFTMTGGSIAYDCASAADALCPGEENNPKALFSISTARAAIALTDVTLTNNTPTSDNRAGTLLTVGKQSTDGGSSVRFTARGTALTGNVTADGTGSAALAILSDDAGTGSSLTGAVNAENTAKAVSLTLDKASLWTVTGTSYVTTLNGLDLSGKTVNNIDGGGHCVYYSGAIDGAAGTGVYALSGGGFLAPAGSAGLNCN